MREDARDDSPVIDTIPPNGKGVVYLGEVQGSWIFVQYDRAKGWVERRFVSPVASRGWTYPVTASNARKRGSLEAIEGQTVSEMPR